MIFRIPKSVIGLVVVASLVFGGVYAWAETTFPSGVKYAVQVISPSATPVINFNTASFQTLSVTQAEVFSTSNLQAGRNTSVRMTCDSSSHNLSFPAGWHWIGTEPTSITADKIGLLTLISYTSADSGVLAAFAEEE